MSHDVSIRYRYKLFAHKLARVGKLFKWQSPNVIALAKARVETALDWAQVMTKI